MALCAMCAFLQTAKQIHDEVQYPVTSVWVVRIPLPARTALAVIPMESFDLAKTTLGIRDLVPLWAWSILPLSRKWSCSIDVVLTQRLAHVLIDPRPYANARLGDAGLGRFGDYLEFEITSVQVVKHTRTSEHQECHWAN